MVEPELMHQLLEAACDFGASDLHLAVGDPPVLRVHGDLQPLDMPVLEPEDTELLMRTICTEAQMESVQNNGGADFGLPFEDRARFRVSVFKQKGRIGLVLRQIPNEMIPLKKIGLPEEINELLYKPRGLILVTGPTGSGKTTTLTSMLNFINEQVLTEPVWLRDMSYAHRIASVPQNLTNYVGESVVTNLMNRRAPAGCLQLFTRYMYSRFCSPLYGLRTIHAILYPESSRLVIFPAEARANAGSSLVELLTAATSSSPSLMNVIFIWENLHRYSTPAFFSGTANSPSFGLANSFGLGACSCSYSALASAGVQRTTSSM